eukprot:3009751-Amphidinium_carterae.1
MSSRQNFRFAIVHQATINQDVSDDSSITVIISRARRLKSVKTTRSQQMFTCSDYPGRGGLAKGGFVPSRIMILDCHAPVWQWVECFSAFTHHLHDHVRDMAGTVVMGPPLSVRPGIVLYFEATSQCSNVSTNFNHPGFNYSQ